MFNVLPFHILWEAIVTFYKTNQTTINFAKKHKVIEDDLVSSIIQAKDDVIFEFLDLFTSLEEEFNSIYTDTDFLFRFKQDDSLTTKLKAQSETRQLYKICNDVIGFRFIIKTKSDDLLSIAEEFIKNCPNDLSCRIHDQSGGKAQNDGYKGIHVYVRNHQNNAFPIEIQFWTRTDALLNDYLHGNVYKAEERDKLIAYAVELRDWLKKLPVPPEDSEIKSYEDYLYEKAYSMTFGYEREE